MTVYCPEESDHEIAQHPDGDGEYYCEECGHYYDQDDVSIAPPEGGNPCSRCKGHPIPGVYAWDDNTNYNDLSNVYACHLCNIMTDEEAREVWRVYKDLPKPMELPVGFVGLGEL